MARKFGYLPYMIERYIDFLGTDNTIELLNANERLLTPSIRINTLKISVDELKKRLDDKGFKSKPIVNVPYGLEITKQPQNLGSLHEFLQGYYYLQNIASMLPPIVLNPNLNDVVIDMCAAPGSKSTQLAQIMENKGTLILVEKNKKRIPALETNIRRMGVFNSVILNLDAISLNEIGIKADKVLLDAPCTGEGLIVQDPSRKRSKSQNDINNLSLIQEKLLNSGLNSLKSGGSLLYSTCSIAPEENELVIDKVLRKRSGFSIIKLPHQFGVNGLTRIFGKTLLEDIKNSQRLYPHLHGTIGFYLCLIKKTS